MSTNPFERFERKDTDKVKKDTDKINILPVIDVTHSDEHKVEKLKSDFLGSELKINTYESRKENNIWTSKYRPEKLSELQGINSVATKIRDYIANFKPGMKPLLISGPPGCGKTSTIYAIAKDLNLEIFELNASDDRDKDSIVMKAGGAMCQASLFFQKKLILLEEVDGLSGSNDRGGLSELIALIPKSKYPVVLTANDPWDKNFSSLRSKCEMITFSSPSYISVAKVLERICVNEGITHDEGVLNAIAMRNGGDFRGAINDLQLVSCGTKNITKDNIVVAGDRRRAENILNAVMRVLKTTDAKTSLDAFENVDEDVNEQMLFMEENIPIEYTKYPDLAIALDRFSRADVFRGRIPKQQHWRYLVYVSALMSAGVSLAKTEKYPGFTSYKPNSRILKIWLANQSSARKKSICEKISSKIHMSKKKIYSDFDAFLTLLNGLSKSDFEKIVLYFEFDSEDILLLKKSIKEMENN